MSAFALHVIAAVGFGLSAPAAAVNAAVHYAEYEWGRAAAWVILTGTYATLAVAFALLAAGR